LSWAVSGGLAIKRRIAGEAEGPLMVAFGHACFEKLTCAKTERLVRALERGEAHCTINNPSREHQVEFDWLDEVSKWSAQAS
jgi:hypothetical protein